MNASGQAVVALPMIPIPGLVSCDVRAPIAKLELLERALLVGQYNRSAWEKEAAVHVVVVVDGGEGIVVGEGEREWQLNELS